MFAYTLILCFLISNCLLRNKQRSSWGAARLLRWEDGIGSGQCMRCVVRNSNWGPVCAYFYFILIHFNLFKFILIYFNLFYLFILFFSTTQVQHQLVLHSTFQTLLHAGSTVASQKSSSDFFPRTTKARLAHDSAFCREFQALSIDCGTQSVRFLLVILCQKLKI